VRLALVKSMLQFQGIAPGFQQSAGSGGKQLFSSARHMRERPDYNQVRECCMKSGLLSSPMLPASLAGAATLIIAGLWIFAESDSLLLFLPGDHPHGSAFSASSSFTEESGNSTRDSNPAWHWAVATAAALCGTIWYARRTTRRSLAGNATLAEGSTHELVRMQAADQLRDALAVFNRQAFNRPGADDDLPSLHRAFVSARIELQKRNARLMYDSIGASHIQAVQQMLTEMEGDLRRHWPKLTEALKRLPERPSEDDIARFQAEAAGNSDYPALMSYLSLLRSEIREELVHAELRYRRLLCA
jgi:hypothetical protein